jgi:outer membrane protein W
MRLRLLRRISLPTLFLFTSCVLAIPVWADVVELKDGSRIKGNVVTMDETHLDLATDNGLFRIDRRNIVSIINDDNERAAETVREAMGAKEVSNVPEATESAATSELLSALPVRVGARFSTDETDAGLWLEAGFFQYISRNFAVGPSIGFSRADITGDEILAEGQLTMVPISLKIRVESPDGPVHPFLEAGIGYYFLDTETDASITNTLQSVGLTYDEDLESTVGQTIGIGIDFDTSATSTVGIGASYLFLKPDAEFRLSDSFGSSIEVDEEVDLSGAVVTIGATIRF